MGLTNDPRRLFGSAIKRLDDLRVVGTDGDAPTSEDWELAVLALRLVEDLGDPAFREDIQLLARTLEREGLAAHRGADRWEGHSVFTSPVDLSEFEAEAIWARVQDRFTDRHWRLVGSYISRLGAVELDVNDSAKLRRQAATILDAAQFLVEIAEWYEQRIESIGTRDLVNDTIVSIMTDWNVQPTDTARQLSEHRYPIRDGRVKMALLRHRERVEAGHNDGPRPMQIFLRRRAKEPPTE